MSARWPMIPFLLLVLSATAAAAPLPTLIGARDVTFERTSDPNLVRLADGTALTVIYGDGDLEKAWDWPEGRTLRLGFDLERGTVLVDPKGGLVLPVVDDLGEQHPIAVADDACQSRDRSTMGIGDCLEQALARWDRQLNINYQHLLRVLDADRQVPVRAAQRAWLAWRDAQFQAISATYDRDGTMWGLVATSRRIDIVREQAVRLGQLAADGPV